MESESLVPLNCPIHKSFLAGYCCLDPNCPNGILSCVLCVKGTHSQCRRKYLISLSDLPNSVLIESPNFKNHLNEKFTAEAQHFLQKFSDKTLLFLYESQVKIMQKAKENLKVNSARFSIENWSMEKSNFKVEARSTDSKIILTDINRVDAAGLKEYVRSFENYLTDYFNDLLKKLNEQKISHILPVNSTYWGFNSDLLYKELEEGILLVEPFYLPESVQILRCWSKTAIFNSTYHVVVEGVPGTTEFEVGLASEKQVQKFKAQEEVKLNELYAVSAKEHSLLFKDNRVHKGKGEVSKTIEFYLEVENGRVSIFSRDLEFNFTANLNKEAMFFFVGVKSNVKSIFVRELI